MTKNFQEITLTSGNLVDSMVGSPGILSFSGTPDSAAVTVTLTDGTSNDVLLGLATDIDPTIANPVTAAQITAGGGVNVQAERLTFTASGGLGSENITVRWYPVGTPY